MKNNTKLQSAVIIAFILFSVALVTIVVSMNMRNNRDMRQILENSIKEQLISTSIAARSLIDVDAFYTYRSLEAIEADRAHYDYVLANLRALQKSVNAVYIYALAFFDGSYHFIFDTDEESTTLLEAYDLSDVHKKAFLGVYNGGVRNVVDEWGSFNTGAVPIIRNGIIIGIIATDTLDTYIQQSDEAAKRYTALLIGSLVLVLIILAIIVCFLMYMVKKGQDKLYRMANYDVLTNLPNRQHLMNYLPKCSERALIKQTSFAFMLVDLDNFKKVNDNAGHDAGDELLIAVGQFIEKQNAGTKSFRAPAGTQNITARIGGDEFVIIRHNISSIADAEIAAAKLLSDFKTYMKDNHYVQTYHVGLSIGVALFPFHTEDAHVLIKYADIAMYNAKRSGKGNYCIYADGMIQEETEHVPTAPADRRRVRPER